MNYYIEKLLADKNTPTKQRKEYLTIFGFASILPIFLLGVVAIYWMFFFEKLYIATDISPFVDFTGPTITFIGILFVFMSWKWIIEARINQAFFNTSLIRAAIPEIVQIFCLFGFFIFLDTILKLVTSSVVWV